MTRWRKRRILLSLGVFSLLLAVGVSFFWFHWFGPLGAYYRRGGPIGYPDPLGGKKEWAKTKKRIRRTGWEHDDFVTVGRYGDSEFAAEMIRQMKRGQDISQCYEGHKDSALRMITNQDAGDTVEDWQEWWRANKDKTQEEWIREGFKQAGLTLHSPLTKEDMRSLLALVGRTKGDTEPRARARFAARRHLRHNAMRWLRDSDVDPRDLIMSDLAGDEADALLRGLVLYTRWAAHFPKYYSPGVLSVGMAVGEEKDWVVGCLLAKPWFMAGVYCLLAITFGGGVLCLRLASRKRTPRTDVGADDSNG